MQQVTSKNPVEIIERDINDATRKNEERGMKPYPAFDVAVNWAYGTKRCIGLSEEDFAALEQRVNQTECKLGLRTLQDFMDVRATVPEGHVEKFALWVIETAGTDPNHDPNIFTWLHREIENLIGIDEAAKWIGKHPLPESKAQAAPTRIVRTAPKSETTQPKPRAGRPRNAPPLIQPAAIEHTFAGKNPGLVLEYAKTYLTTYIDRLSMEARIEVIKFVEKASQVLGMKQEALSAWLDALIKADEESRQRSDRQARRESQPKPEPKRDERPATAPAVATAVPTVEATEPEHPEQATTSTPQAGHPTKQRREAGPRRQGRKSSRRDDGRPNESTNARENAPKPKPMGRPDGVSEEVWAMAEQMASESDGLFDAASCLYEVNRQRIEAAKTQTAQVAQ